MNAILSPHDASRERARSPAETWLLSLAPLVSPLFPVNATKVFRNYLPLLQDVAAEAFNRETLEQAARCAGASHGLPRYGKLRAVLAAWYREHRPARRALSRQAQVVPEHERCTPAQAAEILRRYGVVTAPRKAPPPARPAYLTGAALAEARRRAGIRLPATEASA